MEFQRTDLELFSTVRNRLHQFTGRSSPTAYSTEAKLLWVGKHYLMVRTGPQRFGKEVELWSREKLLIRRGSGGNAMMEIALAALDPAIRAWGAIEHRRLHQVGRASYSVVEGIKGRRWGKKLLADLIVHAEKEDNNFEAALEAFKARKVAEHKFSQDMCDYAERSGFKISGTGARNGAPRPIGGCYKIYLDPALRAASQVGFQTRRNRKVVVSLKGMTLDGPEFEILVGALRHIKEKREFELAQKAEVTSGA